MLPVMVNAFQIEVGARIRALRKQAGMTQRELATAAELNWAFAGRIERGLQNVTLTIIGRIALNLGRPVADLFAGIELSREMLEAIPEPDGSVDGDLEVAAVAEMEAGAPAASAGSAGAAPRSEPAAGGQTATAKADGRPGGLTSAMCVERSSVHSRRHAWRTKACFVHLAAD